MAKYRINLALWQVPTKVVNEGNADKDGRQRALLNTLPRHSLDKRMALLRKRVEKAEIFFKDGAQSSDRISVTVFAAPEYLFTRSDTQHFIHEDEKDKLLEDLAELSTKFRHIILFPGTIAWKQPVHPNRWLMKEDKSKEEALGEEALAQRNQAAQGTHSTIDIEAFDKAQKRGDKYYLARNTCYVMHDGENVLTHHKRANGCEVSRESDGADVFFVQGVQDNVFDLEGLSFGLKICAEVDTRLSRLVDVQVVISASSKVRQQHMQIKPGAYCCHADAIYPPTVWKKDTDSSSIKVVTADSLRRGGGPITQKAAISRHAYAQDFPTTSSQKTPQKDYAEEITDMRGRTRYYRLDYEN
jgi:predicted amidohydrolase